MVASHFMEPGAILPANSSLWKLSKIDVRKPTPQQSPRNPSGMPSPSIDPSRANATAIPLPSNPSRIPSIPTSAFIHPDTITPRVPSEQIMSPVQAEEALKDFFEAALIPEDDTKSREIDDGAGEIEGLRCTLMKHQIEGLEFLHEHESKDDKGKSRYGGILAD